MKRILLIMTSLLLVLVLPSLSLAEITPMIIDDADLLSSEEESELYTCMLPICDYGTPIFWSTAMDHHISSVEPAAEFLRGKIGEEEGILFLIDMTRRRLFISSSKELQRIVTTSKANVILDQAYRKATNGDYLGCAMDAFKEIHKLLQKNKVKTDLIQWLKLLFETLEEPNQNIP